MPGVRMLSSGASAERSWETGDVVEMTPAEAAVWADGVRGELAGEVPVETPELNRRRRGPQIEIRPGQVR